MPIGFSVFHWLLTTLLEPCPHVARTLLYDAEQGYRHSLSKRLCKHAQTGIGQRCIIALRVFFHHAILENLLFRSA
jgi:hypothetical protein